MSISTTKLYIYMDGASSGFAKLLKWTFHLSASGLLVSPPGDGVGSVRAVGQNSTRPWLSGSLNM